MRDSIRHDAFCRERMDDLGGADISADQTEMMRASTMR